MFGTNHLSERKVDELTCQIETLLQEKENILCQIESFLHIEETYHKALGIQKCDDKIPYRNHQDPEKRRLISVIDIVSYHITRLTIEEAQIASQIRKLDAQLALLKDKMNK